jgi:AraC family transcriptional regulator
MAISAHTLASGAGWQVSDFVCDSGPDDKAFEERHEAVSLAVVTAGSFRYRSARGTVLLGPGSVLLGNPGQCFECGHEHGIGDRCLCFAFAPDYYDAVLSGIPGARRPDFRTPSLPPSEGLTTLLAAAEAARDEGDGAALEEYGLRLAALASAAPGTRCTRPSPRDCRRIGEILRLIEAKADESLPVSTLATLAGMSPYHFLRTFRAVAGLTPHQYILRLRLHRAAVRLRRTDEAVSAIAFQAGFNDLSTFNRRFRRVTGVSPRQYRAG